MTTPEIEKIANEHYQKYSLKDSDFPIGELIQRVGGFITGFKEGYNEAKIFLYTEEEMLKFGNFCSEYDDRLFGRRTQKQLLETWKILKTL